MKTKELPASVGARLLSVNRTSIYYKGTAVSEEEFACKEIIDHLHTDNPTWGARQMSAQLKLRGYHVGRRKARRPCPSEETADSGIRGAGGCQKSGAGAET